MDSNALIAVLQSQGGLDVNSATALELLNGVYQPAVAQGRYRLAEYSLGSTVAAQDHYSVDDQAVVSIERLKVGSTPYEKSTPDHIWQLGLGNEVLNVDGVFSEGATATGGVQFVLFPVPTAVLAITGFVALEAVALDTGSNTNPIIPVDLHDQLADAAILLGKGRLNGDGQAAQGAVQLRDDLADKLRRRRTARLRSVEIDMSGV